MAFSSRAMSRKLLARQIILSSAERKGTRTDWLWKERKGTRTDWLWKERKGTRTDWLIHFDPLEKMFKTYYNSVPCNRNLLNWLCNPLRLEPRLFSSFLCSPFRTNHVPSMVLPGWTFSVQYCISWTNDWRESVNDNWRESVNDNWRVDEERPDLKLDSTHPVLAKLYAGSETNSELINERPIRTRIGIICRRTLAPFGSC